MTGKKKNPIAEQSRQWLLSSLLTLMNEKDYSEITVTEIASHALLSRRTFYRSFASKEEILHEHFLSICEEYVSCFETGYPYTFSQIIEIYFTFWEERLDFLALLKKNHLFYYLLEEFNHVLPSIHQIVRGEQRGYKSPLELNIALLASAGALWNILAEWAQLEKRPSPREMSQIVAKAIEGENYVSDWFRQDTKKNCPGCGYGMEEEHLYCPKCRMK